jgi:hypothetical protein
MREFFRPTYAEAQDHTPRGTSHPWHLPELTVYITDSCALSCTGCITYNNYALGGHLELSDEVRLRHRTWSRLIAVDQITVLGGEPLSHPGLGEYMQMIEQTWARSRWSMVTNGRGLAQRTDEVMSWLEQGWDLEVSSHSREDYEAALAWWSQCLAQDCDGITHRFLEDESGPTHYWQDSTGKPIMQIGLRDHFYAGLHEETAQGQLTWQKLTNAKSSHRSCPARDCTHLVDGVMYRCPIQAVAPRLAQRFEILGPAGEIASKDLGYDPLAQNPTSLSTWMARLGDATEQCRLCEWPKPLKALGDVTAKKIRLVRRVNLDSPATDREHPASLDGDEHLPEPNNQAS